MPTGIGYDIHRLQKGRKLVLGGVELNYEKGLAGHSDADVLLHAVTDAILGCAGAGDIGERFPDTDEKWRDASSALFIREALAILRRCSLKLTHCDAIIIAEKPNLTPYKKEIKASVAELLNLPQTAVNIKAKTAEGLGVIGAGEAIAALTVVSAERG